MMIYFRLAMPGKQAKILSLDDVNDLLVFATCTRHPLRNRLIVLFAAKAGLRASEIANLTWDMVLDPTGDISAVIELRGSAMSWPVSRFYSAITPSRASNRLGRS
jgi:integrase